MQRIPVLSTRALYVTGEVLCSRLDDCATRRPIRRKSASVSADDAYQGQIRMDRRISSPSPSARSTCSVNVRGFGGTLGRESAPCRRGQSFASCRSESSTREIPQMQRSVTATPHARTTVAVTCQSRAQRSSRSVARLGAPESVPS